MDITTSPINRELLIMSYEDHLSQEWNLPRQLPLTAATAAAKSLRGKRVVTMIIDKGSNDKPLDENNEADDDGDDDEAIPTVTFPSSTGKKSSNHHSAVILPPPNVSMHMIAHKDLCVKFDDEVDREQARHDEKRNVRLHKNGLIRRRSPSNSSTNSHLKSIDDDFDCMSSSQHTHDHDHIDDLPNSEYSADDESKSKTSRSFFSRSSRHNSINGLSDIDDVYSFNMFSSGTSTPSSRAPFKKRSRSRSGDFSQFSVHSENSNSISDLHQLIRNCEGYSCLDMEIVSAVGQSNRDIVSDDEFMHAIRDVRNPMTSCYTAEDDEK